MSVDIIIAVTKNTATLIITIVLLGYDTIAEFNVDSKAECDLAQV